MNASRAFRSRAIAAALAFLVPSIGLIGRAGADRSFDPRSTVGAGNPIAGRISDLGLEVTQQDGEIFVHGYHLTLSPPPSTTTTPWRFDGSMTPAGTVTGSGNQTFTVHGCSDLAQYPSTSPYLASDVPMEGVGLVSITLQTARTRDQDPTVGIDSSGGRYYPPGPVTYNGGLWFLRNDPANATILLCGRADLPFAPPQGPTGPNSYNPRVQPDERYIVFELALRYDPASGWNLSWNYDSVTADLAPGQPDDGQCRTATSNGASSNGFVPAASGACRVNQWMTVDSPTAAQDVSILSSRLDLRGLTLGNHNDVGGRKEAAPFSQTPTSGGIYPVLEDFVGCTSSRETSCETDPTDEVRATSSIAISSQASSGYHPMAQLSSPQRFSVFTGGKPVTFGWTAPAASDIDPVKGYVLIVAHPDPTPQDVANYYGLRLDLSDPASSSSCAPDGNCSVTLPFPLRTQGGATLDYDGLYSASLVVLYADGGRSDGRCDDGSLVGAPPPCAGGLTPAFTAPGYSSTEFLLDPTEWPRAYEDTSTQPAKVLFVDFAHQRFQLALWQSQARVTTYSGGETTVRGEDPVSVAGSDESGGAVLGESRAPSFSINVAVTPALSPVGPGQARGVFVLDPNITTPQVIQIAATEIAS